LELLSVSLSDWSNILSVGASVATLIGLLGFIAACVFLAYSLWVREKRKQLELLPKGERSTIVDEHVTRYGLSLEGSRDEDLKFHLVLRELELKSRKHLTYAVLAAVVVVLCFAMVTYEATHGASSRPSPDDSVRCRTPDQKVICYMNDIVKLWGAAEARNPGWQSQVRQEGTRLADLIGVPSEDLLRPARRIIQHEYQGFALLMVANTFIEPSESEKERKQGQIDYATRAIHEFDLTLARMKNVTRKARLGDKDAADVYEWITGDSKDLYRTHYLRAIACAVVARAGGERTKVEVRNELAMLPAWYLNRYPAANNPDLAWAIKD
jgi:hypothetical protein